MFSFFFWLEVEGEEKTWDGLCFGHRRCDAGCLFLKDKSAEVLVSLGAAQKVNTHCQQRVLCNAVKAALVFKMFMEAFIFKPQKVTFRTRSLLDFSAASQRYKHAYPPRVRVRQPEIKCSVPV